MRAHARGAARAYARGRKRPLALLTVLEWPVRPPIFACSSCGHESPKWHGRCPGCGEWNTLVEERAVSAARSAGPGGQRAAKAAKPVPLREVEAEQVARIGTGIAEFDRVLGGGLVPGSLVLIGGSPGIGKSTLTLGGARRTSTAPVLYVTGEESPAQVRLRAERISAGALNVPIIAETDVSVIEATLEAERPAVCVIDSVQTMHDPALSSAAGSVAQVREATARLMRVAKQRRIALFIVGHVTKDGTLAGPRVMEHLVDCVLQFEGERERTYRTVRALKNRFGSTNEVGVFEMREDGLIEVPDASARFVGEATRAPGLGRAVRDGGLAAAAGRGAGAGGAVRDRAAAARGERHRPQPAGAGAGGAGAAGAASASAPPTCSCRSRAACASTSRAPTWRSRWRSRPQRRGSPSATA